MMELDLSHGMLRLFKILVAIASMLNASPLDFTLIKKGTPEKANTLLVIGGIQGDEPGGFLAASLVGTKYTVTKGSLWVVPNLNFPSIVQQSRGTAGDMNRKFVHVDKKDPDYKTVTSIKSLILDKEVSMVVNLHDGSGFYREKVVDKYFNPKRWGNSCIIDQVKLDQVKYGNLEQIAKRVADNINANLQDEKHRYHVKNTKTAEGDQEMLKSLTYFAVKNKKAAFANESSKMLPTHLRVYYQLLALEEYMRIAGIEFERHFELTPEGVHNAINKDVYIAFFGDKLRLDLENPRKKIGYFPMPKDKNLTFNASNPLTTIIKEKKGSNYDIYYGNRHLMKLHPQYFEYSNKYDSISVNVDGKVLDVKFGSSIKVDEYFNVVPEKDLRVNVIGYVGDKSGNESGQKIEKKDIIRNYSIDKNGKKYRVEIYDTSEEDKFAGMFLVEFSKIQPEEDSSFSVAMGEDKEEKIPN